MTPLLASDIEGRMLTGAAGTELGKVEYLLYHPSEPRVIGATVRPPAAMYVVTRPETFLPLSALELAGGGVATTLAKLPTQRQAAAPLGFDPDLTVIWTGMPVAGPAGEPYGTVSDVQFDHETGTVLALEVAAGVVADAAHGRFLAPGDAVIGYAAGAIHLTREAGELEATGGLAKGAAAAAVAASEHMAKVGRAVEDTVVAASGAAGTAIKAVTDTKVVQTAAKRARSTWRDSVKAFRDGMKGDE